MLGSHRSDSDNIAVAQLRPPQSPAVLWSRTSDQGRTVLEATS